MNDEEDKEASQTESCYRLLYSNVIVLNSIFLFKLNCVHGTVMSLYRGKCYARYVKFSFVIPGISLYRGSLYRGSEGPIHFTVTFTGTQHIHSYTGDIVISRIVISGISLYRRSLYRGSTVRSAPSFDELYVFRLQAEELIKREMISMLRHDIVNNPTAAQIENLTHKKSKNAARLVVAANRAELEREPLENLTEKEIANAKELLGNEMEFVKSKMAHGDLPIESYTKVWEECYAQVS